MACTPGLPWCAVRSAFKWNSTATGSPEDEVHFTGSLGQINFGLENRSHDAHETNLQLRGLPEGTFRVSLDRASVTTFSVQSGESWIINLPLTANGGSVSIVRNK
jgi:hypothetical protein